MITVRSCWERYRKIVMSGKAPPMQVRECKMAFYGGATSILQVMMELGDEKVSEDIGAEVLQSLIDEVRAFRNSLVAAGTEKGHGSHKLH